MNPLFLTLGLYLLLAAPSFGQNPPLAEAAEKIIDPGIVYDPTYFRIKYPGGDVPAGTGVCTDVVVRAYRLLGIDLQKEVHEDMRANFDKYPKKWGLARPDANIDHRRVPNLMKFFERHGKVLKITDHPPDYKPGNIVCWDLGGGILHIGIVSNMRVNEKDPDGGYALVHNIGYGQVPEACLFKWRVIGHYLYKK